MKCFNCFNVLRINGNKMQLINVFLRYLRMQNVKQLSKTTFTLNNCKFKPPGEIYSLLIIPTTVKHAVFTSSEIHKTSSCYSYGY